MDLVGFSMDRFDSLKDEYLKLMKGLRRREVSFIPVSGLLGDNMTTISENMDWYTGGTLMDFLESCPAAAFSGKGHARFSVQYATQSETDKAMIYAGRLLSGTLKKGAVLSVFPQKEDAIVDKIYRGLREHDEASAGDNISICIAGDIAITRGDMLSDIEYDDTNRKTIDTSVCWLSSDTDMEINREYIIRINAAEVRCKITEVLYEIDGDTFARNYNVEKIGVNQFAKVKIELSESIFFESYTTSPQTGRGILIDTATNATCAALMID